MSTYRILHTTPTRGTILVCLVVFFFRARVRLFIIVVSPSINTAYNTATNTMNAAPTFTAANNFSQPGEQTAIALFDCYGDENVLPFKVRLLKNDISVAKTVCVVCMQGWRVGRRVGSKRHRLVGWSKRSW